MNGHPLDIEGEMLEEQITERFDEKVAELSDEDKKDDPRWFDNMAEEATREIFDENFIDRSIDHMKSILESRTKDMEE
jgi:hypothetical protein